MNPHPNYTILHARQGPVVKLKKSVSFKETPEVETYDKETEKKMVKKTIVKRVVKVRRVRQLFTLTGGEFQEGYWAILPIFFMRLSLFINFIQ